ncbi:MAG: RluA family pseudouridine synthase, partial [Deltaproteobacteria bacterium]|nr:RluA family pseudouridine synthase [Deltaproteobacteria bacterium]
MTSQYSFGIDPAHAGLRLDIFLSKNTPFPRSQIQKVIEKEGVKINNQIIKKANYRLKIGERVEFRYPTEAPQITPEPIALSIIYEDRYLLVINKPAGLVVQPAPGHYKGTLAHALLYYYPKLSNIGGPNRPGIVHRLDKDTSGIMVIAKDVSMYNALIEQFKERKIEKEYLALVLGVPSKREG